MELGVIGDYWKSLEEPLETPEKWLDRCRSYKRTEHEGEQCWMVAQITGCKTTPPNFP
jgi:hypothetical protein